MATVCETALQTIATNTANTFIKLDDVNTNLINVQNYIKEVKDLLTLSNTKSDLTNTKLDKTNELLTSLITSIKGAL